MHSKHRNFGPDGPAARRSNCKMGDGNHLWDKDGVSPHELYDTTARRDFYAKEIERREAAPPSPTRKPLPFKGEATNREDFKRHDADCRRDPCLRAKYISDDNPLQSL